MFGSPAVANGRLFVDNPRNETQVIHIEVTRNPDADGERVIDARYRVPSGHVLEFDGVLEPGTRYLIRAWLPNSPPIEPSSHTVDTCDSDDSSRQTSVRIRAARDGVAMVSFGCEQTYQRREDAQYANASEYRLGDGTSTPG